MMTSLMSRERRSNLDRTRTHSLVEVLFEDDLHARRVESLANGVTAETSPHMTA